MPPRMPPGNVVNTLEGMLCTFLLMVPKKTVDLQHIKIIPAISTWLVYRIKVQLHSLFLYLFLITD